MLAFALSWVFLPAAYGAGDGAKNAGRATAPVAEAPIVFDGKFSCFIKRQVLMPFPGTILQVKTVCGEAVKKGEVLAIYDLTPDVPAQIRRRLSPPQINDLQIRLTEVEKTLGAMELRRNELQLLSAQSMASPQSLSQVEKEIQLLNRQKTALDDRIRQESLLRNDDLALLNHQLGVSLDPRHIPREGSLVAPMDGHVILIHPEMKNGAEFPAMTQVFIIGVLDPMVMRAQVHEIEAVRIAVGDRAEVQLESMPQKKVEASVTRVSWYPSTPGLDQPSYYEVELAVSNPGLDLKEGLKGRATVRKAAQ